MLRKLYDTLNTKLGLGKLLAHMDFAVKWYFSLGNGILRILKVLIHVQEKTVMFCCYAGERYDDSPKAIYEHFVQHHAERGFTYIWVFKDPSKFDLDPAVKKIKLFSLKFYFYALRSQYFISNATLLSKLEFLGKKTVYLNTWHGSAFKKIGLSSNPPRNNFCPNGHCIVDIMLAQSSYDIEIFSQVFALPKERFLLSGLPRNDELVDPQEKHIQEIKSKLQIPLDKKVLLYAPTYRYYDTDERTQQYTEKSPVHFEKWYQALGDEYIILFRAHYYINTIQVENVGTDFVIDVSRYSAINDLILVSDLLVSDYSSLFFDYSITGKPMICYPYDYELYKEKVGLFLQLEDEFTNGIVQTEEGLLDKIRCLDYKAERRHTITFSRKFIEACGKASKTAVDYLLQFKK